MSGCRSLHRAASLHALAMLILLAAGPARAASPSASIGYDFDRGPSGQETRSIVGLAGLGFGSGDLVLGALRFDDSTIGPGTGMVAGGSSRLAPSSGARVLGTRFVGDDGYRAWRIKAGPQWSLGGASLWIFYQHDSNNLTGVSDGGAGELMVPLAFQWTVKLSGSYGRSGDVTGYATAIGAAWTPVPHLKLSGEVGVASNALGSSVGPGGRPSLLPGLLGDPRTESRSETGYEAASTASLAVRIALP